MLRPLKFLAALLLLSACPSPEQLAVGSDGQPNPKAPPQLLNDHANKLDDAGDHAQAVTFYEAALTRYPPENTKARAEVHFNLGLAYRRQDDFEAAERHYAQSIELDPAPTRAYLNISVPLRHLGRSEEAISYLRKGLEQDPEDLQLLETLANALIEQERHDEALPVVRKAFAARRAIPFGGTEHSRWLMRWGGYLKRYDQQKGSQAAAASTGTVVGQDSD